jgi:translation initiation factor 2 subunit 2
MLECDACGARRPVKAVKKAAKVEEAPLVEGKVYELMIQDIGKKGDGIAKTAGSSAQVLRQGSGR